MSELQQSGGSLNINDGTCFIYADTIGSSNLTPNMFIKTNTDKRFTSSGIVISDVTNLQEELNQVISNPFSGKLQVSDLQTDDHISLNTELQKISNLTYDVDTTDLTVDGKIIVNNFECTNAVTTQTLFDNNQQLVSKGYVDSRIVPTSNPSYNREDLPTAYGKQGDYVYVIDEDEPSVSNGSEWLRMKTQFISPKMTSDTTPTGYVITSNLGTLDNWKAFNRIKTVGYDWFHTGGVYRGPNNAYSGPPGKTGIVEAGAYLVLEFDRIREISSYRLSPRYNNPDGRPTGWNMIYSMDGETYFSGDRQENVQTETAEGPIIEIPPVTGKYFGIQVFKSNATICIINDICFFGGLLDEQGEQGDVGLQGIQGVIGSKGDNGDTGAKGDTGASGSDGNDGGQGPQGPQGDSGTDGVGSDGTDGTDGATGSTGATGEQGPRGDTGLQGPVGPAGDGTSQTNAIISDSSTPQSMTSDLTLSDGVLDAVSYKENNITCRLLKNINNSLICGSGTSSNPSGADSVFIGTRSGASSIGVQNSIAIGTDTLRYATGNFNTSLGDNSMRGDPTEAAFCLGNVSIGKNSMELIHQVDNCISIGYNSERLLTNGTNRISIGYNSSTTQDNEVNIGNDQIVLNRMYTQLDVPIAVLNSLQLTPIIQPTAVKGKVYYDIESDELRYYNGVDWMGLLYAVRYYILTPKMASSNEQGSYVTESSVTPSFNGYKAFNRLPSDSNPEQENGWLSSTNSYSITTGEAQNTSVKFGYSQEHEWLVIEQNTVNEVFSYKIKMRGSNRTSLPVNFSVFGRITGQEWFLIEQRLNIDWSDEPEFGEKEFIISNPAEFNDIGISVSKIGVGSTSVSIGEIKFYGKSV
jgi:hypothetical protein